MSLKPYRPLAAGLAALVFAGAAGPPSGPLPKPDANGSYLFWSPQEQLIGYRNIEKIFPTHTIKRGAKVHPLPKGKPLAISYAYDGATFDADRFMDAAKAVGVLVIHHDKIVLERYHEGYGPDQRWTSFSVGKSISSTLAGAALKDGYIKSLEDPVTAYLPGLKGSAYEGVTVRNLLNMTSGVKWNEDYADPKSDVALIRSGQVVNGQDPIITYMARLPREAAPGTKFVYKTGETHLVGLLTRAAIGRPLADYAGEKIWKPYGMEKDAVWMLDPAGNEFAGCCISATLRDFGRFGMFFKNGAKVGGKSIVTDDWIKQATTGSSASKGYGFKWWLTDGPAYNAQGIFGQQIHIDPSRDLVVVIQSATATATDRKAGQARAAFIKAVEAAVDGVGKSASLG